MSVAVYVRVSTQQQVQTQTIQQQLDRLRAHSAAQGWTWRDDYVFRDDGYSGASLARPGLDRLRDQVAAGSIERVVIASPDRLARKYVHQMLLIDEWTQRGCHVEFLDQPLSQDPHDQLLLQIRGAVAEYERALIAERLRRGRLQRFQAGTLLPWTHPPYGYAVDPQEPRALRGVRPDPGSAALVAEVFALYLEPGQSIAGVAKHLMALHVPAPSGGWRWNTASVRKILTNPVYTGAVYAGRTRVRPVERRRSALAPIGRRTTPSVATPPEEWLLVGQVPALVTPEVFALVQAKLATNGQRARRHNTAHPYLLRALVSCGHCHSACVGRTRRQYSYYDCAGKAHPVRSSRDQPCTASVIAARALEAAVWADLCCILTDTDTLHHALARAQGGAWLPQELQARRATLHKAHTGLGQQIERLTHAYLAAVLSLDEYGRRRRELEVQRDALAQQARQLEADAQRQMDLTAATESVQGFCERVQQGLETATFAQRRQLVELLIDRVVVTDDEVEIRYVIPTSPRGEQTRFYQLRIAYLRALLGECAAGVPGSSVSPERATPAAHVGCLCGVLQ